MAAETHGRSGCQPPQAAAAGHVSTRTTQDASPGASVRVGASPSVTPRGPFSQHVSTCVSQPRIRADGGRQGRMPPRASAGTTSKRIADARPPRGRQPRQSSQRGCSKNSGYAERRQRRRRSRRDGRRAAGRRAPRRRDGRRRQPPRTARRRSAIAAAATGPVRRRHLGVRALPRRVVWPVHRPVQRGDAGRRGPRRRRVAVPVVRVHRGGPRCPRSRRRRRRHQRRAAAVPVRALLAIRAVRVRPRQACADRARPLAHAARACVGGAAGRSVASQDAARSGSTRRRAASARGTRRCPSFY